MQKIKIYPAPHLEVRIHVSDEMEADLRECQRMSEQEGNDGKDCNKCGWNTVDWLNTGFCELPAVREKILEEEQDAGENSNREK